MGSGHRFASSRLAAQRSVAGWMGEQMGGLSYLEYIRGLAKRVEGEWEGVQVRRRALRLRVLLGGGGGVAAAEPAGRPRRSRLLPGGA